LWHIVAYAMSVKKMKFGFESMPAFRAVVAVSAWLVCMVNLFLPSLVTAQESVYNGAFVGGNGGIANNLFGVLDYETNSGKGLSIVNYFKNWDDSNGTLPFSTTSMDAVRAHGSIPMVTWQPEGASPDATYALDNIVAGNFDAFIQQWALDAKAWGHPFFLRFAHEMNGTWYPWCSGVNGNTSADYIAAWQHVHDIFVSVGATNVTWVWCVNTKYTGSASITGLYPGDNYVDWISLDSYNRTSNTWGDFSSRSQPTLDELVSVAPGKPIMVAETGCHEDDTDVNRKGQWYRNAMKSYLKVSMPRIKAWVYFNGNNPDGNDWRITTSTNAQAAYQESIGLSYYSTNRFANLNDCPIQPMTNDATAVDTNAPFVSIVKPAMNHVRTGSRVEFRALASDKSGINKVQFLTNNVLAHTENLDPFQYFWTAPTNAGQSFTIIAKAFDTNGNTAVSTIQIVTRNANLVSLTNSDAANTTSFDMTGNWDSGQLPMAGDDFFVGSAYTLRTPTDNQTYNFAGDSLTLAGTFSFKQSNVVSVADLRLTNGLIGNFFAGGIPNVGRLAGNLTIITNATVDAGGNVGAITSMQILASISGSGGLTINRPNVVTFSASNSYSGPVLLNGTTLELDANGSLAPSSLTLANYYSGGSGFNMVTNIVRAGGSLNVGYGPTGLLRVGYRNSAGTNCIAILDVSSQSQFTANVGEFSVGVNLYNDSLTTAGNVLLATNNFVTATNVFIADSAYTGGGTSAMTLGVGSNYFSTPLLTIGARKGTAQFTLPTGGSFRLDNGAGRTDLTIGGENFSTSVSSIGTANLSGGKFSANLGSLVLGQKLGGSTGGASGTLTLGSNSGNSVNVNSILLGSIAGAASGASAVTGTLTFGGGTFLVSSNVTLGSFSGSFGSASGILNLNGGTFTVGGNIVNGGGGSSFVNVSSGTLVLSNQAGAASSPLSALNLTNASLHLSVNGSALLTNIVVTTVSASGTSVITIDTITNVSASATIPLISYAGTSPFAGLTLAALPVGFTGNLVNNTAARRIDLSVIAVSNPPSPLLQTSLQNGTNFTVQLNSQSGFNYILENSPSLAPVTWSGIKTNPGGGPISFVVPVVSTNPQQFFRVRVQ
jgi:hypothetical protein